MVGHVPLEHAIGVQIPASQPNLCFRLELVLKL